MDQVRTTAGKVGDALIGAKFLPLVETLGAISSWTATIPAHGATSHDGHRYAPLSSLALYLFAPSRKAQRKIAIFRTR